MKAPAKQFSVLPSLLSGTIFCPWVAIVSVVVVVVVVAVVVWPEID